jgi:glutaredoxin
VIRAVRFGATVVACFALVASLGGAGCTKHDDGTAPSSGEALPELVIRDDTPNVLLTWIDGRGVGHTEVHAKDVPPEGRAMVRVVVSDRDDGTHDRFYVVDLSKPRGDGAYVAKTIARRAWEDELEKRRAAYLGEGAPPATAPSGAASGAPGHPPPANGAGKVMVIIYGASWCHPCHEAAAWLKARGVPYVLKDIEADRLADEEMQAKLESVGRRGGSIPVIDVQGQILVGFSEGALANALKKAGQGTVL